MTVALLIDCLFLDFLKFWFDWVLSMLLLEGKLLDERANCSFHFTNVFCYSRVIWLWLIFLKFALRHLLAPIHTRLRRGIKLLFSGFNSCHLGLKFLLLFLFFFLLLFLNKVKMVLFPFVLGFFPLLFFELASLEKVSSYSFFCFLFLDFFLFLEFFFFLYFFKLFPDLLLSFQIVFKPPLFLLFFLLLFKGNLILQTFLVLSPLPLLLFPDTFINLGFESIHWLDRVERWSLTETCDEVVIFFTLLRRWLQGLALLGMTRLEREQWLWSTQGRRKSIHLRWKSHWRRYSVK